ncbi:cytochrome P450 [Backusella circina FSU 941]|nr:cytochrome P450 [Backusella circina FSU 941]
MSLESIIDISTKHLNTFNTQLSRNEKTVIVGLAALTLYNLTTYINSRRQKLNKPPVVAYKLPIIGHSLYMMWNHNKFIDWCTKKYGELYTVNIMGKTITIARGKAAEEALKSSCEDLSLHHGVIIDILHMDYLHEDAVLEIGETILPSIVKVLLANPKMPSYFPSVQEGFTRAKKDMLSEEWPTLIHNPNRFFQNFVAYMSVPTLVGPEFKENMEIIKSFAECTGNSVKNTPLYILFPKIFHPLFKVFLDPAKKHIRVMEKYFQPVVHQYRSNPNLNFDHNSFLRTASLYCDNETGEFIPAYRVAHSILLVAFESVHTTSSNTSAEIDTALPNRAPITSEALENMSFLNNLLREVLRQKSMRDYTFYNGYQIPKGRVVQATSRPLNLGLNMNRIGIDAMDPSKSMERRFTAPARDFISFSMGKHLCPENGKRPEPYKDFLGLAVRNCEDPLPFTPRVL